MVQSTCSVVNCDRKVRARGICEGHYTRLRKKGDVLAHVPLKKKNKGLKCAVDLCVADARCLGYCEAHYQRLRNHGSLSEGVPVKAVRAVDAGDGLRECLSCGCVQPLDDFHLDAAGTGGRRATCKQCRVSFEKARYASNPAMFREKYRADRRANPERYRQVDSSRYERDREKRIAAANYYTQLRRSRLAGSEVEQGVTIAALRDLDGEDCCYCGCVMVFASFGRGSRPDNQATLEHVIPISRGGGHTFSNCAVACWRCNISKGAADDWTVRGGHRLAARSIEVGA